MIADMLIGVIKISMDAFTVVALMADTIDQLTGMDVSILKRISVNRTNFFVL